MVPDVIPKKGSSVTEGTRRVSRSRERGPCTAIAPMSRLTSSIVTARRPTRSANQAKFGSAEVSRNSSGPRCWITPSSSTKPRSSSQVVYWAFQGGQRRMSRASMPDRKRSASRPAMRYLYSGEVSKMPALLRTAKYSNLSDAW